MMKSTLRHFLHRWSHSSRVSALLARRVEAMRIIMLHGVGGAECPSEVFEQFLKFLKNNFRVVPLDVLIDQLKKDKVCNSDIALTFDDGLRNNFTVVYPLLVKNGIPATFFVCPGLIESEKWLWNHEARQRLLRLSSLELAALLGHFGETKTNVNQAVEWMKLLSFEKRTEVEESIRAMTPGFTPTSTERFEHDIMTWNDIKSLSPELVTIGAHTTNHQILSSISEIALNEEIIGCKSLLEEKTQLPVRYFCYPNGIHAARVVDIVRSTYSAAVTTEPGFIRIGDDIHLLNRIPIADNLSYCAWRLHRPRA